MKCLVYAFYNKKVGAYEKPIVNNFQKEDFQELVIRDVIVSDNEAKERMKECSLYYLGNYDDATGKFELEANPEFMLDIAPLIIGKENKDVA